MYKKHLSSNVNKVIKARVVSMGKWWPAKNDKSKNLRFYDLRVVGYKKLQNKNLGC